MRILFLDLDGTVRYSRDPSGFINKPEDEGCAKACGIPFIPAEDWRAGKAAV